MDGGCASERKVVASLPCRDLVASVPFYAALFGTVFMPCDDAAWRAEVLGGCLELFDGARESYRFAGSSGYEFGVTKPMEVVRRMREQGITVQQGCPAIVRDPDGREIRIVVTGADEQD